MGAEIFESKWNPISQLPRKTHWISEHNMCA